MPYSLLTEAKMPLNTRGKKREPIPASCELVLNESTAKTIKLNVPVDLMSGSGIVIKTSLIDISTSGCAVDSPYLIPAGVLLDIRIEKAPFITGAANDRKGEMKMTCRITSCTLKAAGRHRLGVMFTRISKEDQEVIDSFIRQNDHRKERRWNISK